MFELPLRFELGANNLVKVTDCTDLAPIIFEMNLELILNSKDQFHNVESHNDFPLPVNVERNRVATVDIDSKLGVNRHSDSRNCYPSSGSGDQSETAHLPFSTVYCFTPALVTP